jgi:acyl carrier protein
MPQQTQVKTTRQRFDDIVMNLTGLDEMPPDTTNLTIDLDFDELDHAELAWAIEDEFEVAMDDGEMEDAATIGQLLQLLERSL